MIPRRTAVGGASGEQLLCGGGVGQRDAQCATGTEREVQILLMQLDAEAWIESALDHALAVHFENARGSKAAHKRLPHSGGIGPGFGGVEQRLADNINSKRENDLVRDLGGMAV